jgi:hypothetical protein
MAGGDFGDGNDLVGGDARPFNLRLPAVGRLVRVTDCRVLPVSTSTKPKSATARALAVSSLVVDRAVAGRRRVVYGGDVGGQGVSRGGQRGAVTDLEAETGVSAAVGVGRRREDELARR